MNKDPAIVVAKQIMKDEYAQFLKEKGFDDETIAAYAKEMSKGLNLMENKND